MSKNIQKPKDTKGLLIASMLATNLSLFAAPVSLLIPSQGDDFTLNAAIAGIGVFLSIVAIFCVVIYTIRSKKYLTGAGLASLNAVMLIVNTVLYNFFQPW